MKFPAALAAAGLALAALSPSHAQTAAWPNKPVRIVVGFAAGTPPDVFARMYGEYASRKLNTPFVIDNRPGSAGNLATDAVAKAPADGYTVLYNVSTAFTINPSIYGKLPFDAEKDLVPLATTMRQGLVLIAGPTFKADDWIWSTATTADGVLYFGDFSGKVYGVTMSTMQLVSPVIVGRSSPAMVWIEKVSASVQPRCRRYMIASRAPLPDSSASDPSGL